MKTFSGTKVQGEIVSKDGNKALAKVIIASAFYFMRVTVEHAENVQVGQTVSGVINEAGYMDIDNTTVKSTVKVLTKKARKSDVVAGDMIQIASPVEARYSGYGHTPLIWVPTTVWVKVVDTDITPVRGTRAYMIAEFFVEGLKNRQSVKVTYDNVKAIMKGQNSLTTIPHHTLKMTAL